MAANCSGEQSRGLGTGDPGSFWHLLCAFRQMAKSAEVIELARAVGGGTMTPAAQEALLDRCVHDKVCMDFPPGDAYVGVVLKKAVLAAEKDGEEVTDALVEEHTRLLFAAGASPCGGSLGDGEPRWVYKTFAYREDEGDASAEGGEGMRLLILRTSPNMLEGGTGCHEWQAGFRLAEAVLGQPALVRGRSVLEIGCGTGGLGVVVARLGPRRIILTDGDEQTLANLRHNLGCNGAGVSGEGNEEEPLLVEASTLEWEAHARGEQALPNDADVVLGADLIYDPGSIAPLVEVLSSLLLPRGTASEALIANALRNEDTLVAFARAGREAGFRVDDVTEELGGPGRFAHHSVLLRERIRIHRFTPSAAGPAQGPSSLHTK